MTNDTKRNNMIYFSKPGVMSCAGTNIEELWNSVTTGNQSNIKKVTTCTNEEFFAARVNSAALKPSSARFVSQRLLCFCIGSAIRH